MRATIVIMAIIGLLSIVLDRVHEAGPAGNAMALSGSVSESGIPAVEAIALETEESDGTGHGVVHLKDIQAIADLGSLLLIGVALAGLVAAPRRESRKARAARRIT
jgi:hypothetical protein